MLAVYLIHAALATAQPHADGTLCDANSTLACHFFEYLQPPTAEQIEERLRQKRAALRRQVQREVFGVRTGWDRAWHAVKDVGSMGAGALVTFKGGALPKPALLLQSAALSNTAVTALPALVPLSTFFESNEVARLSASTVLAVGLVHLPGASLGLSYLCLGMHASRTLTTIIEAALRKWSTKRKGKMRTEEGKAAPEKQQDGGGSAGALPLTMPNAVGFAFLFAVIATAPAAGVLPLGGVPVALAGGAVAGAFVLISAARAHLGAEWLHILDTLGERLLRPLLVHAMPAVARVVRAVLRTLRAPLAALLYTAALGARAIVRRVGWPALRLARAALVLALRGVRGVLRLLRAPLRLVAPRTVEAVGRAGKAVLRRVVSVGKLAWRHLRTLKAIARAPKAVADAANLLREQWRVTLPWVLASCGVALQLGHITAAGVVPYLMTALDPRRMLVLLWKLLRARVAGP